MSEIPTAQETLAALERTCDDLEPVNVDAARAAATNAADPMAGHRIVLLEIWRPLRYIGSRGPRTFCRECIPLRSTVRGVTWGKPSPWRVMDREFARRALGIPGHWFDLEQFPGVKFCVRKFNAPTLDDWREAQALRMEAVR